MSFSRPEQLDAIIRLDISFNDQIVKALFPNAWERFKSKYGTWALRQQKSSELSETQLCE